MVSADYTAGLSPFTAVAITDDGRRIPLFDESADFSGIVTAPELAGSQTVSFEITASGVWTLVLW